LPSHPRAFFPHIWLKRSYLSGLYKVQLYYQRATYNTSFNINSNIMPGVVEEPNNFQSLVQSLSDKLGPGSGINSDDVDEKELQQLMQEYTSNESDWSKYSKHDPNHAYTRNLVDKGNGKSNLVRLSTLRVGVLLTPEARPGVVTWKVESYSRVSSSANR
jgi:hypothetical protein